MITAKEALEIYSENLPNEISKTLELCNNHIVGFAMRGHRRVSVETRSSSVDKKVKEILEQHGFVVSLGDGLIRISW